MESGREVLRKILRVSEEKLNEALAVKSNYHKKEEPKKNGGVRIVFAPHPKLKEMQKKLLRRPLYCFKADPRLHGFVRGRSNVSNAAFHASAMPRYVLRLDFKDAFPSVKTEHIRPILKQKLADVLSMASEEFAHAYLHYRKDRQLEMFSANEKTPYESMVDEVVELILALVTFRGRLPQGAPTSPHLLNLVLSYSGILDRIEKTILKARATSDYFLDPLADRKRFVWVDSVPPPEKSSQIRFSFYSDDLTISSSRSISGKAIQEIIRTIEEHGIFRINYRKILYFNTKQAAPVITGVRVSTTVKPQSELENFLREKGGLVPEEIKETAEHMTKPFGGKWVTPRILLSKRYIRKVRGILHRAVYDEGIREKASGHIAYIKSVYCQGLPPQISKPYDELISSIGFDL